MPPEAQFRLRWIFLYLALLLASPFIGFAVVGKVGEAGMFVGLGIATIPLTVLAVLTIKRWFAIRRLPREIAEEWRYGRVIPPDGAPVLSPPVRFSCQDGFILIRTDGVIVSRGALLGFRGVPDAGAKTLITEIIGECFVTWSDIREWEVCTDSDGPDYYRLPLQGGGHVLVRRFVPHEGRESNLLDAIRAVGKRPVRMFCDLDDR